MSKRGSRSAAPAAHRRSSGAGSNRVGSGRTILWPLGGGRAVWLVAVAGVAVATLGIYGQTLGVGLLAYEDSFYLARNPYVNVPRPLERLAAVWTEPYFANYHPVTTTTWLVDRALAPPGPGLDGRSFRIAHLVYAALGALLVVPLALRLGLPAALASSGAIVFAAHPIHTEVVAWLSARKDLIALVFTLLATIGYTAARTSGTLALWRRRHLTTALLVLLAVMAKPTAVILPALLVALELCAADAPATPPLASPLLRRALVLAALGLVVGGVVFAGARVYLAREPAGGVHLALVPAVLSAVLWLARPSPRRLAEFRAGSDAGLDVIGPPHVVYAAIAAIGSAWTLWAQGAAGAIKGGLTLIPTLNLTCDAMLAYAGKVLVPARMTTAYVWNEYPSVSVRGALGALLVVALAAAALRLAFARERALRTVAFGIFWYLIAFAPVANLVPTSTKMADRYLFLPSVGAILAVLGMVAQLVRSRAGQLGALASLATVALGYGAWSHARASVWCGTTTPWRGIANPDLSLWTAAVQTHPDNHSAMTSLAGVYLAMDPPEVARALEHLQRAVSLAEAQQGKIAGGKLLDLSPLHQMLGTAFLERGRRTLERPTAQRRADLEEAVRYLEAAARFPLGFGPADARLYWRLAEAREELAGTLEVVGNATDAGGALARRRDELRAGAMAALEGARRELTSARVPAVDPDWRGVHLAAGTFLFGRAATAPPERQAEHFHGAIRSYAEAAALMPDDPRPVFLPGTLLGAPVRPRPQRSGRGRGLQARGGSVPHGTRAALRLAGVPSTAPLPSSRLALQHGWQTTGSPGNAPPGARRGPSL